MKSKCVIIENYTQYTNSERNKSPSRFERDIQGSLRLCNQHSSRTVL